MKNILKEYIKNITKDLLVESNSNGFDFETFKNLKTLQEQLEYCSKTLSVVGEGGGRIVYDFDGTKVLKIAKASQGFANGIMQNKKELKLYVKLHAINAVPEIYNYDPKFKWILTEKVNVLSEANREEIQQYTDLYWDEMETVFYELFGLYTPEQILNPQKYPKVKDEIEEITDFGSDWRNNPNIQKLFKIIKAGVGNEEILVPSHLGIRSNGDLVLVDYGF
jgi:hypothetical protein